MNFLDLFARDPAGFVVKLFLMVASVIFLIYAVVVYRQTQMMVRTVRLEHNWTVVLVSLIQVLIALVFILIAFIIV